MPKRLDSALGPQAELFDQWHDDLGSILLDEVARGGQFVHGAMREERAERKSERKGGRAREGLGFRSPATVLKTAGLPSTTVHQRPPRFDR